MDTQHPGEPEAPISIGAGSGSAGDISPPFAAAYAAPLIPLRRSLRRHVKALSTGPRRRVEQLLGECLVKVNGNEPCDIRVLNDDFYARVLADGSLGLGESYMDGWWTVQDLDGLIYRLLMARLDERIWTWGDVAAYCSAVLFNLQRRSRAFQVGQRHYDIGNDLYELMLDRRMIYSCGYWHMATTLDAAQEAKLELVFRKLGLQLGQRVLDVGCGWGGALKLAAERYAVSGVGITVSREQAAYARKTCENLPITIQLQDYRDLKEGQFDHIYSIGMFEHVGAKNYRTYMQTLRRVLRPDGRFLLHTIGSMQSTNRTDPWLEKYIFPNSMLPSQRQIIEAIDGLFVVEGWQRLGRYYDRTLLAWRANFERHWPQLRTSRDARFFRMWRFYLSASAASFRAGKNDVWQVLLTPVSSAGGNS
jgi:cyclopropane-fatty-acyl-phospholipid synthase